MEHLVKWEKIARVISLVSLGFELLNSIGGLVAYGFTLSSGLLAFGLSSVVDVIATSFVVWRFWGGELGDTKNADRREHKADIGVAIGLLAVSLWVLGESISRLVKEEEPEHAIAMIIVASISIVIDISLAIAKFKAAHELDSAALTKDGVCSVAVGSLSVANVISGSVYTNHPDVWFIDPIVGIIVSIALFVISIRTFWIKRSEKWWTNAFWSDKIEAV
eukprot:TRINITY_DN1163_c0_g1_i2.p1 TRINITY_DN1163_c0_g1~~TRINITY_DN1163_c0_g1_i2.p1  ORF type:complete len:220 (-),score=24.01 TRINITY_DN1163_c0_g1_i2:26-685(-)